MLPTAVASTLGTWTQCVVRACSVLLFLQNRVFTVRTDFLAFGNRFAAHHAAVFGLTDMYDLTSGVNSSENFHDGSSPFCMKF